MDKLYNENIEIIKKIKDGHKELLDDFIKKNNGLVVSIVKEYINSSNASDFEDMCQNGIIGLLEAIKKFDLNRNVTFSTYAVWWIRQGITRGMDNESRTVRIPVHMSQKVTKINKYIKYCKNNNIEVTYKEIASKFNISEDRLIHLINVDNLMLSTNKKVNEDSNELSNFISDKSENIEDKVLNENFYNNIIDKLNNSSLTELEKNVIIMRYGLGCEKQTLNNIGKMIGYTRQGISAIEIRALDKLRNDKNFIMFKDAFGITNKKKEKKKYKYYIKRKKYVRQNKQVSSYRKYLIKYLKTKKIDNVYSLIRDDYYENRPYRKTNLLTEYDGSINKVKPKELTVENIYYDMKTIFENGYFNTLYLGKNSYKEKVLIKEYKYIKYKPKERIFTVNDYLTNLENYFEIYTKDSIEKVINKRLCKMDIEDLKDVFRYDYRNIKPWYDIEIMNLSRVKRILEDNIRPILEKYADKKGKIR